MEAITGDVIAEAFGLAGPIGRLHPLPQRGFVRAWRLRTGSGQVLIKNFWPHDELPWQGSLETAMELQQRAVRTGIDTPEPIMPVEPVFGSVGRVEGHGLFRAYPYIEHRPLADEDVAGWLGQTLAGIHRLWPLEARPAPNWWYGQDPPLPDDQWRAWLDEGEQAGTCWAPALRQHLDLVLEQSDQVITTFDTSPPYVISHLDVEPQNILITDGHPVLIDWDSAGGESVPLETAYVLVGFARRHRDPVDRIRHSHRAYRRAGGAALPDRPQLLDREIGRHLASIATALSGFYAGGHRPEQIRERIDRLPAVVARARAGEELITEALFR